MKKIGFITIISLLLGTEPKTLDQFVVGYLLVTQSKMIDSPSVWQDVREGYLRTETIIFTETVLDSLDLGLSSYQVAKIHFPIIDQLREKVQEGKDFDYKIESPPPSMANVNYFSSVRD